MEDGKGGPGGRVKKRIKDGFDEAFHKAMDIMADATDVPDFVYERAIKKGDMYTVRRILKSMDVNRRLHNHETAFTEALIWCPKDKIEEVIKLLLKKEANVNLTNDFGVNAVFSATAYHDISVIKMLLEAGGDINAKSKDGYTAFMSAARENRIAVMELYLQHGADMGAVTDSGTSALMEATRLNRKEAVVFLLKRGVDTEAFVVNYAGERWDAYRIAKASGFKEIVAMLQPYEDARLAREAQASLMRNDLNPTAVHTHPAAKEISRRLS